MATQTRRQFIGSTVVLACTGSVQYETARASAPLLDVPLITDAAGRLLAPAYVNGHGPYRFMVDSGASHCAISRNIVTRLALPLAAAASVTIRSTTGRSTTQLVQTESFEVGSLRLARLPMPVIDATDGGVVGSNAFLGKRVDVDFEARRLIVSNSTDIPANHAMTAVPLLQRFGGLLLATGTVGAVDCKLIVDTGAQATIGNLVLARRLNAEMNAVDPLVVQTPDATIASARSKSAVPIALGREAARNLSIAYADLPVFALWQLAEEPALLLGMDFFARLARFVIDYRHSLLSIRIR